MVNITQCGLLLAKERDATFVLQLRKVGGLQSPLKSPAITLLLSLLLSRKACEAV